jgi:hypothetical protein
MVRRSQFQCPSTGVMLTAVYAFGKVLIRNIDDIEVDENISRETAKWIKQHSGKRFRSLDTAEAYLIRVSEGQSDGFEESNY